MGYFICKNPEGEMFIGNKTTSQRVCPAPRVNGKSPKTWQIAEGIIEVVDDIDELTGEIRGKKAVVNQAKLAAHEAAKAQAEQARQDEAAQKQAKIQALKLRANPDLKELMEIMGL